LAVKSEAGSSLVVVSGLPRSGTSLMMQLLAAGGLALTCDGERAPDAHNPRGYFEDARVKRLRREARWVADAAVAGTALKVVAPLLPSLPVGPHYCVIWMQRDWAELSRSQKAMLGTGEPEASEAEETELRAAFDAAARQARSELRAREISVHEVEHAELLRAPESIAAGVGEYLARAAKGRAFLRFDAAAAARVVEPSLYRQRVR